MAMLLMIRDRSGMLGGFIIVLLSLATKSCRNLASFGLSILSIMNIAHAELSELL